MKSNRGKRGRKEGQLKQAQAPDSSKLSPDVQRLIDLGREGKSSDERIKEARFGAIDPDAAKLVELVLGRFTLDRPKEFLPLTFKTERSEQQTNLLGLIGHVFVKKLLERREFLLAAEKGQLEPWFQVNRSKEEYEGYKVAKRGPGLNLFLKKVETRFFSDIDVVLRKHLTPDGQFAGVDSLDAEIIEMMRNELRPTDVAPVVAKKGIHERIEVPLEGGGVEVRKDVPFVRYVGDVEKPMPKKTFTVGEAKGDDRLPSAKAMSERNVGRRLKAHAIFKPGETGPHIGKKKQAKGSA